jgi:proline iminopeptidase
VIVVVGCVHSAAAEGFTESYTEVNGVKFFSKRIGNGSPLVVVHGGPGFDFRHLEKQFARLAAKGPYEVIFYDRRGTGGTDATISPETVSMEQIVDDLEALRRAWGFEKMTLAVASLGGLIGMHYGMAYPENLSSLILVGSTGATSEWVEAFGQTIAARQTPEDGARLEEIAASESYQQRDATAVSHYFNIFFKAYFYDQHQAKDLDVALHPRTAMNMASIGTILGPVLEEFDVLNKLDRISCPVLIIHGEADPIPITALEKVNAALPNSTFARFEKVGHFPYIEAPEEFDQTIVNFLSKLN